MIESDFFAPLIEKLLSRSLTLSLAESCTGGMISAQITSVAGISNIYEGAIISYSNQVKKKLLHVPEKTLQKFGAVSEETCLAMLNGLKKVFQTKTGIAVTGIAGPSGGSEDKPVGTVFIGCYFDKNKMVNKYHFPDLSRIDFQKHTMWTALKMLKDLVEKHC